MGKKKGKQQKQDIVEDTTQQETSEENVESTNDAQKIEPINVEYCPICTFPIEYCEFSPFWDKCAERLKETHPDLLEELIQNRERDKEAKKNRKDVVAKKKAVTQAEKKVEVYQVTRGKKKSTHIKGVEVFDQKPKEVGKFFQKKLACGATVDEDKDTKLSIIEIQGDHVDDVIETLETEFKIPKDSIVKGEPRKAEKKQKPSKPAPTQQKKSDTTKGGKTEKGGRGGSIGSRGRGRGKTRRVPQ